MSLLNGDFKDVALQVGAESTEGNQIKVEIKSMGTDSLVSTLTVSKMKNAFTNVTVLVSTFKGYGALPAADKAQGGNEIKASMFGALNNWAKVAIKTVSQQRSDLGAIQNRLEHTINNLDNVVENTTSAESQIRDTDMATEMVKYSNNNILAQAGQAMLAQSNQANQGVLSLLG